MQREPYCTWNTSKIETTEMRAFDSDSPAGASAFEKNCEKIKW